MEFSEVKRISKFFLLRGLKVEKIQIAEIVFEIVSGSFHDILVNLCDYFFILDTESIQELWRRGSLDSSPDSGYRYQAENKYRG